MSYDFDQFCLELLEIKEHSLPLADSFIFYCCEEYHRFFPQELPQEDYPSLSLFITPYFQYADITLTYDPDDPRVGKLTPKAREFAIKLFTEFYNATNENVKMIGHEGLVSLSILSPPPQEPPPKIRKSKFEEEVERGIIHGNFEYHTEGGVHTIE